MTPSRLPAPRRRRRAPRSNRGVRTQETRRGGFLVCERPGYFLALAAVFAALAAGLASSAFACFLSSFMAALVSFFSSLAAALVSFFSSFIAALVSFLSSLAAFVSSFFVAAA